MSEAKKILSNDPRQAVEEMITITEEMVARIEIETNALATNDGTTFTMNEDNKEYVASVYENAANEFHGRLPEFQSVDKALIEKLSKAQASLKQSTKSNIRILEKFQKDDG